jgi:glycine/sarcosine N-methyltransferase
MSGRSSAELQGAEGGRGHDIRMDVPGFYDSLAATYDALYPDWEQELSDQAATLLTLLGELPQGARIADTACGIGTQLVGLAAAGFRLFGSDVSPVAVARARAEALARGLRVRVAVADMRALPWQGATMDAVVCADNAVTHLLADQDVQRSFAEAARVLTPGGRMVVTTRDYDAVLPVRPSSTPPQVTITAGKGRTISFQLWHWRTDTDIYDVDHFQIHEPVDGARRVDVRSTTFRAYTRARLTELARAAGLAGVTWHDPRESGYFQPAMTATNP